MDEDELDGPEDYHAREGEPSFTLGVIPLPTGRQAVMLQADGPAVGVRLVMRPAVAKWLGEQLLAAVPRAESRLIVPGPGAVNLNGGGNDHQHEQ